MLKDELQEIRNKYLKNDSESSECIQKVIMEIEYLTERVEYLTEQIEFMNEFEEKERERDEYEFQMACIDD